jgi:hypothetical protein
VTLAAPTNQFRYLCDPLGDATIRRLYAENSLTAANHALAQLVLNDQPDPAHLPPAIADYLDASAVAPPWADPQLIAAGERVFAERGPLIMLALVTASLAECYALGNGVQVLYTTHRMDERHVYRRIYETAQFIVDVCSPGGLGQNGRGLRVIQKVRLMHASVRHLLLAPVPPGIDPHDRTFTSVLLRTRWDTAQLGLPINWQDQAFTLQSFGYVVLRCLERLGSPCTADEQRAWIHLWAVAGHHLGIAPDLIPHDPVTAEQLYWAIRLEQQRATPEGRRLTAALGSFASQKLHSGVFGNLLVKMLLRTLCDRQTCDLVGVPDMDEGERLLARFTCWVSTLLFHDPQDRLHRELGMLLVTRLAKLPREWERGLFQIPDQLLTRWSH